MKLVCDSSSIISLCDNNLLWLLKKVGSGTKIVIPPAVKREIVDDPLATRHFELRAIQMNKLLLENTVSVSGDVKIPEITNEITCLANSLLSFKKKPVKILHAGEAEAIACLKLNGGAVFMVDERTVRLLVENPEKLKEYMEDRTGYSIEMNKQVKNALEEKLAGIEIIRSADFFAQAYENGLLDEFGTEKILEAGLYGLRYAGCAIAEDEIKEYVKMLI